MNDEGITAFMWTGAYRLPSPNITGTVRRDICLIESCIGVGECAISVGSSLPSYYEIRKTDLCWSSEASPRSLCIYHMSSAIPAHITSVRSDLSLCLCCVYVMTPRDRSWFEIPAEMRVTQCFPSVSPVYPQCVPQQTSYRVSSAVFTCVCA